MSQAKWIWKYGEYEIYHHKEVMCRRQERGCDFPEMSWRIVPNEVCVRFQTKMHALTDTTLKVVSHSKGMIKFNGQAYPVNKEINLKAGTYDVTVCLQDLEGFASCFIDSEYLKTDETWMDTSYCCVPTPVACEPAFYSEEDNPAVFPFSYETITPVSVTEMNGGLLYEFDKEYFGPVTITEYPENEWVRLTYGESVEEALDYPEAVLFDDLEPGFEPKRPARAFRYLFTESASKQPVKVVAEYEYLPIDDIADFQCEDDRVKKIWDMCSYTFHLNSREVYLDGIQRDRWCWSGDAYQSFFINLYLYFEPQIIKRTILALLGKQPYLTHVNTINDYSAYLIAAVWDYYYATEDKEFVGRVWENVKALYHFMTSRTDEKGYVVARQGDWIFIDWSEMDKDGVLCAEQILMWNTHKVMGLLAGVLEEDGTVYEDSAKQLKNRIMTDFWDEEKSLFYDYKADGSRQITRHPNIFAILYDFVDQKTCERIAESVIYSEEYVKITTPYFKTYELMAIGKLGNIEYIQDYIDSYWGGMLDAGATTVWERYDPEDSWEESLAMYGKKYGTSLCHAWGCGPIYLLGRFCCGVSATDLGYRSFEVKPNFGHYKEIQATIPVKDGVVMMKRKDEKLEVTATVSGGTLIYKDKTYELLENQTVVVE